MRSAATAGIIALGFGCNAILGLDETTLQPDAPPARARITQQTLTAVPDVVEFPPIDGMKRVQLGLMSGPLADVPVDDNGAFQIPPDMMSQPYRLVYQPPGDPIPHEVQWSFVEPHLVVPFFGKPGQPAAPPGAIVQITAMNHPGGFDTPLVFSYGTTWTVGGFNQTNPGNPANYEFTTYATPIDGPLATLQSGTDTEMLVDFTGNAATGGARFKTDLAANTTVPANTDPWTTTPQSLQFTPASTKYFSRLTASLGLLAGGPGPSSMIYAGVIPSTKLPPFAIRPFQPALDPLAIPMFSLAKATGNASAMSFANPFGAPDALPVAIAYQVTQMRTAGAATLYHSFQWVRLASQVGPSVPLDSGQVGIPVMPTLAGTLLKETDGQVVALGGASTATLEFMVDQATQDCIATLYQIDGAAVNPMRSYQVIAPATMSVAIQIESSIFQMGPTYVFGIVCRGGGDHVDDTGVGFPAARTTGDYSQVGYPFSISTVFPATFTVIP